MNLKLLNGQLHKWLMILVAVLLVSSQALFAQYIINGSASQPNPNPNNCFTITPNAGSQRGSVWNQNKIQLSGDFDFTFKVNLGSNDGGADGIAFVLQSVGTNSLGLDGGHLGYAGISPSLDIEFDTYYNSDFGDPVFDHISIQKNGNPDHNSAFDRLAGPFQASDVNTNIEDGLDHTVRITWNSIGKNMLIYFDGVLRQNWSYDIVTNIFGGNQNVYWGFTGGTGALSNLQTFCVTSSSFQQSTSLSTNISGTNLSCNGAGNGSAAVTATGGVMPYSFSWSNGATTSSISNLAAGTYTATVTDAIGATVSKSITITQPAPVPVPTIAASGPTTFCQGGSVTLTSSTASKNSLSFNGTNHVEAPHTSAISLINSLTLEAWVKLSDVSGVNYVISKGTNDQANGQYGLVLINNGNGTAKAQFHFVKNTQVGVDGYTAFSPNIWYHIAGTWDGVTARLYVNGVLDNQVALAAPLTANTGNLQIGRLGLTSCACTYNFKGDIDEVRIWNVARTAGDVLANKNLNVSKNSIGLVAYYKMDEGNGSTTADAANGNTANLIQNPAWVPSTAPINYSSYLWSPGGSTSSAITATTSGSYSVTVTDANGCTAGSNAISVTQSPAVTATITASGATTFCPGGSVTLTASAGASYLWSTGASTQSITVSAAGNYTVTVTNTEGCSATSAPATITVSDNIPPVVPTLPNITGECSATVATPTTTDNCAGTISGSTSNPTTYTTQGTYSILWTFSDGNGNTSTANQTVIVKDNQKPVVICPANVVKSADPKLCTAVINGIDPVVTDNCTGSTYTYILSGATTGSGTGSASGRVYQKGVTNVTYTATDAAGNISNPCSFTITVNDNEAPSLPGGEVGPISAFYYTGTNFNTFKYSETVPNIVNDWGYGSPNTAVLGNDYYSIKYTSTFKAPTTGNYTFRTRTDDGVRLYVNNQLIINRWYDTPPTSYTGTINLIAGQTVPVEVNWYENGGVAVIELYYTAPGSGEKLFKTNAVTLVLNALGQATLAVADVDPGYTDNCGIASRTLSKMNFDCTNVGTNPVTLTVTDIAGNSSTCNVTVTVQDNTAPVIICPFSTTQTKNTSASSCAYNVQGTEFNATATDNCAAALLTYNLSGATTGTGTSLAGVALKKGTTTITWTAKDAANNTSTCTFNVTVTDNTPPAVPVLPVITAGCSATLTVPTTIDNCAGIITGTTTSPLTYNTQGTFIITWTFNDGNGNTSTANQTIIVNDITNPTITAPANIIQNTDAGSGTATVSVGIPVTADNCLVISVTNNHPSAIFPIGTTSITWTVTDINNNTTTAVQTVTIKDIEAPLITCNPPIIKSNDLNICGAIVNYVLPFATDNALTNTSIITAGCSDRLIDFDLPVSTNVSSINFISSGAFADIAHGHGENNTITVQLYNGSTWVVIKSLQTGNNDYHFGGTSISFPLIPQVSKLRFTSSDSVHCAFHFYELQVKLNSSVVTQITGIASGSLFPIGLTTNTFVASDGYGNTQTCSFTVTVNDTQKPSIVGKPANITKTNDATKCGAVVIWTLPSATDNNCAGLTLTSSHESGSFFPVGTTTVVLTAKDAANNITTCTFTVTVIDNEKPQVTAPPAKTVYTTPGQPVATVDIGIATATDNCGVSQILKNYSSNIFPLGNTTITWSVSDIHGNTNTATQSITVLDNEKPVLIGMPLPIIQANDAGICGAIVSWLPPVAIDNSGLPPVITSTSSPGQVFSKGETIVTYTATDSKGNSTSSSFTITVTDNEAPQVRTKDITITLVNGVATINTSLVNNNTTDNCTAFNLSLSKTIFNCTNIGTNIVTLTASDASGNVATATTTVNVLGQMPASFITPIPVNTINTGGVPTNLYLGYGPQSITLQQSTTGGASFTYSWSGNGTLSCYTCPSPVFTATVPGYYTFTCTATNEFGCTTISAISICVRDIRVPGTNGSKVYVCHLSNNQPPQTVEVNVTSVADYLDKNPGDKLGRCDMQPCSNNAMTSALPQHEEQVTVIKESSNENTEEGLTVKVSPNPSSNRFTFIIKSPKTSPVTVRIINELGQVFEGHSNVPLNSPIYFGDKLMQGKYYAEVIQDKERKVVKIIKVNQ